MIFSLEMSVCNLFVRKKFFANFASLRELKKGENNVKNHI